MDQLDAYADAHRRALIRAQALRRAIGSEAFGWKPAPDRWSAAECVAHLCLAADAWLPRVEAAVMRGGPRGEGPFAYGWLARKLLQGIGPGGPHLRSPRSADPCASPAHAYAPADVLDRLAQADARFAAACASARGLDLRRAKVRYPYAALLRLPLGAALELVGQHALRHAAQAEDVTRHPDFQGEPIGPNA